MRSILVRACVLGVVALVGCGRGGETAPALTEAMLVVGASGTVTDQSGAPIAGAQLDFVQRAVIASATTAADGRWSVSIEEGVYDVVVTPPAGSVFVPQTLYGQTIASDTSLQVVLIAATVVRYAAHVQDRDGSAIAGVEVCLSGACVTTDASGDAQLSVHAGTHALSLHRRAIDPQLPDELGYERSAVILEADTRETITLPNVVLTGVVIEPDGDPVPHAAIYAAFGGRTDDGSMSSQDSTTTDAAGRFVLTALPGSGVVTVTPEPGSGVASLTFDTTVSVDDELVIALPTGHAYSAHLQDRYGSALAGIELCLTGTQREACALSDATGDAVVTVPAGWARRTLRWTANLGASPQLPEHLDLARDLEITGDTAETLTIENRIVRGTVVDAAGSPVANATVSVSVEDAGALGSGRSIDFGATDASGRFVLAALAGEASVEVVPDSASHPPSSMVTTIAGDVDLVVTLPDSHVYTAHVVDRDGTPVPGVSACLQSLVGGREVCALTDANGDAPLAVVGGEHALRIEGWELGRGATEQLPSTVIVTRDLVVVSADVTETITIENRFLSGAVVDADGNPVAHTPVSVYASREIPLGSELALDEGMTDASGHFALTAIAGDALVRVFPAPESGLPFFEVAVSVVDDAWLAVVVQYAGDGVAEPVVAGGTVHTDPEGDGATPSDPVETAVTSPVEGTIEIHEAPITESAPSGYSFLGQQVNITAPVASAETPLVIAITIDGSRIPAGQDPMTLPLFRNGVLVPACAQPGVASPDPCVAGRAMSGDDVVLTALTSAASSWNVGVMAIGDGDGDGIFDDVDVCPIDAEDVDGFQDADGCPDVDDDADGVPDASDACRAEAEDRDGFEDDDGCPEAGPVLPGSCPDFDRDGAVTVRDQVVLTRAMGSAAGDARYQPALDLDRDGDIDVDDLHRVLARRGESCPAE